MVLPNSRIMEHHKEYCARCVYKSQTVRFSEYSRNPKTEHVGTVLVRSYSEPPTFDQMMHPYSWAFDRVHSDEHGPFICEDCRKELSNV